jgi:hypothetical protein
VLFISGKWLANKQILEGKSFKVMRVGFLWGAADGSPGPYASEAGQMSHISLMCHVSFLLVKTALLSIQPRISRNNFNFKFSFTNWHSVF